MARFVARQSELSALPRNQRRVRHPNCPFYIRFPPFGIQPFLCHPVLPGESLKNFMFQARVITDPIKNPIMGWHAEAYFFYVKVRDLANLLGTQGEALGQLFLNPEFDLPASGIPQAFDAPAHNAATYFRTDLIAGENKAINWTLACLQRVVQTHFRDENEVPSDHVITDVQYTPDREWYAAQRTQNDVFDSLIPDTLYESGQDVDVDLNQDSVIGASEIDQAMRTWKMLVANNLSLMTFEDYLALHGIRQPAAELHIPELIRYVRDWQYPSNTVEPTTGIPTSAVSWSLSDRGDKVRFFREPGFVFGCMVVRPKVYLKRQSQGMVTLMNDTFAWLPRMLEDDMRAGQKHVEQADSVSGPLADVTDTGGFWYDVKDLLLYGEQYLGLNITEPIDSVHGALMNMISVPDKDDLSAHRYVKDLADIDAMFKTTGTHFVRADGVVSLQIAGSQVDTSPRGGPAVTL